MFAYVLMPCAHFRAIEAEPSMLAFFVPTQAGLTMSVPFYVFVIVGLLAQMVDGALGMAYGITSSSLLLGLGLAPAVVSASVHAAEVATTGISGISHGYFGNIDRKLLIKLALPGALGGMIGALLLTHLDTPWLRPIIAVYLLILGVYLIIRAYRGLNKAAKVSHVKTTAVIAGFLDAVGGGGWGPMTTTRLISQNMEPRYAIGTVNAAEFFVSLAITIVFFSTLDLSHLSTILGLLIGGAIAAPFAAWLTKHLPARITMGVVGSLVVVISIINIWRYFA